MTKLRHIRGHLILCPAFWLIRGKYETILLKFRMASREFLCDVCLKTYRNKRAFDGHLPTCQNKGRRSRKRCLERRKGKKPRAPENQPGDIDLVPNFHQYDQTLFQGVLGRHSVRLQWVDYPPGRWGNTNAHTLPVQYRGGRMVIHMGRHLLQRPINEIKGTLIHEMIHAYLIATKTEDEENQHGQNFQEQLLRARIAFPSLIIPQH